MRNFAAEIGLLLDESCGIAERYYPESSLLATRRQIRGHLGDYSPSLMFYGTYNAGKSTLLNALLDTTAAPISDAPCTATILSYKLGDYTVFDTPGIDAPIEHEQLSKEHLRHCHAVLFVLSTHGQFDEAAIVGEIAKIYESNKFLILVLNNKAGKTVESGELELIRTKLAENCKLATGDIDFERRVPILLVNAKTAMKARESKSDNLLAASGIPDLEHVVFQSLSSIKQIQFLFVPLDLLDHGLEELAAQLELKQKDQKTVVVDALMGNLREAKTEAVHGATIDIRELRNQLVQTVIRAAHDGTNMEVCFREYLDLVHARIQHRIEQAGERVERSMQSEDALSQVVLKQRGGTGYVSGVEGDVVGREFRFTPEMKDQVRQFVASEHSTQIVKKGLLKLRELKLPGLKGRWDKTLTKWSSKIVKGLGIFLEIAILAHALYSAKKAQDRLEAETARQERALQDGAKNMAISCEYEVIEQVASITNEAFGEIEAELVAQRNTLAGSDKELGEALSNVRGLKESVGVLRASLGSLQ